MVMYDNEFESKENKFKQTIKVNHDIYIECTFPENIHNSPIDCQ